MAAFSNRRNTAYLAPPHPRSRHFPFTPAAESPRAGGSGWGAGAGRSLEDQDFPLLAEVEEAEAAASHVAADKGHTIVYSLLSYIFPAPDETPKAIFTI